MATPIETQNFAYVAKPAAFDSPAVKSSSDMAVEDVNIENLEKVESGESLTPIRRTHSSDSRVSVRPPERDASMSTASTPMPLRDRRSVQSKAGDVSDWYVIEEPPLREGSFGKVHRATTRETGELRAIKTVAMSALGATDQELFYEELAISRQLDHPNIVRLYDAISDGTGIQWYLVMDFCEGGDLFDLISDHGGPGKFKEPTIARFAFEMLDGIKYMHSHNFAHRDLKPENYMLLSSGESSSLKLIDFGLATAFTPGVPMTLQCGTLHYSAPEILRCKYTEKCDIWSVGVVFYMICAGRWPFFDQEERRLAQLIASGPDVFGYSHARNEAAWKKVRGDVKAIMDLIKELMNPDAASRPSARQVLASNTWIHKTRNMKPSGKCKRCCAVS